MIEQEESPAEGEVMDFDLYEEQRRIIEACPFQNVSGIVAGKTNSGKSTLINTVFGFKPEDAATTGHNKPTANVIHKYTREGSHFTLYEASGFETGDFDKSFEEVISAIIDVSNSADNEEQIHFMWYCNSTLSNRFEDGEVEFINEARSRGIIVIIVLTQCYFKANDFEEAVKNLVPGVPVVPVLCKLIEINAAGKGYVIKPFGTDELLKTTFSNLTLQK